MTYRFLGVGLASLIAIGVFAQTPVSSVGNSFIQGLTVPRQLVPAVRALGSHFTTLGSERLTINGSILRPSATSSNVSLIYEVPRKFRYTEGNKTIIYNGTTVSYSATPSAADSALSESLFEDSIDGLLYNIRNAHIIRRLMSRARLDDGKANNYTGPYLDIFQFMLPLPSLPNAPTRTKFFYFDSALQFLDRVRYLSGTNGQTSVETRFQNWQPANGSFAPTVITRTENGVVQFTLTSTSAVVGPAAIDGAFTLP